MSLELALAMLRLAPWLVLLGFKTDVRLAPSLVLWISKLTDGPRSRSQRLPQAQNVVGASFSDAAAGPLSGFTGFQNWRMAPCPDLKGFPRPKMSLELALAMLRLAPWLVLWGFKTDVRLAPSLVLWDFKTDGPKCRSSWLSRCCGWPPLWLYGTSKLTDGPLSRSQRLPQAQNVVGAGFRHAAAGPLSGFMGFQNWRMAPGPDPKDFPKPKMSLELALAMLRLAPSLVLWNFKTDGWPPVPISKASPGPKCRWSSL